MMRLFAEKISVQALICYVLNIVNNCKNSFIFSCIFMFCFFFNYLLYVPADRRKNFDILSRHQNNKVSFTCQLGWVGFGWLHLHLYIYVSLEFLLPTINEFTIQKYNKKNLNCTYVLSLGIVSTIMQCASVDTFY